MDERERDRGRVSPEIFVYATNKNFLNVYDVLRIEKIKIEVAGYDQGSGKQTGIAGAWLNLDDMRLLAHLIISRLFKDVLPKARFEKFGGSERDGMIESRTLTVEWDPGEGGRFAAYPYRVTIANGPGQRTPTGAVQPKGEPTSRQAMRLPEADLMKIMLAVQAYIQAYEAAHHHRLVAAKVRELQDKMAERNAPAPAPASNGVHRPAASPAPSDSAPRPSPVAPPLRVVRDTPALAAERPAAPTPMRPAAATAPRPAPYSRPTSAPASPVALAPEPPDLDMDAPPPTRPPYRATASSRPTPAAPERSTPGRPTAPPVPTTATGTAPASPPARPFRPQAQG